LAPQNLKSKILLSILAFCSVVLLLDWFVFSFLFLKFPNELEWDTSPWYNFLQKKENLNFSKNKKSVLVTGSSVALYSYMPQRVDDELAKSGLKIHSDFFAHVAMSPTDLYYYADEIISKKPDLILYLVNPGDFQMDHFWEEYSEEGRIHAYASRHPVKFYYPLSFLLDHFTTLKKTEILPLLTKSMLYVNKYRGFVPDPIDAYLERHTRSGTSYHNYTGATLNPIQWRKGWTNQKFQVSCELKTKSQFSETIFIHEKDTEILISNNINELYKNSFQNTGWQKIQFTIPDKLQADTIYLSFSISKTVSSKAIDQKLYGKEYFYGIRLSQNFCKQFIERDISFTRIDSMDDQVLQRMTNSEYADDYFEKMYKDADLRPEVQRLYHLHQVKEFLNKKGPYRWSEFTMLEKAAAKFKQAHISFVIVNNPENPLELDLYKDSEWYKDYLKFYSELSKHSVKFYDHKESVPRVQDFIDSHHLSYTGSEKMIKNYSEIIKENTK
jgi:hypothetical protein